MRSNKTALYHLASVVDDADFGVTHVVRGQDKISVADFQEAVRIALGFKSKRYLHTPMLLDNEGKILTGAVTFEDFVKMGIVPQALLSYLISSGYGDPDVVYSSLDDFISEFDYRKVHRNNGKFDADRLRKINTKVVRKMAPKDYLNSFFLYLEKNQEEELREVLENDGELCRILVMFRRTPAETIEIVKNILQLYYEIPPQQLQNIIEEILRGFEEEKEIALLKEAPATERKQFFDGLRWILVGKHVFPDIEIVYQYLRGKKLLNSRIKMARVAYLQYKQANVRS